MATVKTGEPLYEKILSYCTVCPRLYYLLHNGTRVSRCSEALYKPIQTFRQGDVYAKGYRFEAFKEDYMLGQQFSFEETILTEAEEAGCKNIVKLLSKEFTN